MADLNEQEMDKLNVIKKVFIGECTKKEASSSLGLTIRQINRLLIKFKDEGENGFVHKNRGKESKKKVSTEIKKEIVDLYITEYFDYNFTHFFEEIQEKYNLSYKTIDNILTEADIISPEAQHKTIKLYNANMKKAIRKKEATTEQIQILKDKGLIIEDENIAYNTLLRENYFFVMGYRHLFQKSARENKFIPGTTFGEVYSLFEFDRNFRNIIFKNVLVIENQLKSVISYQLSKKYGYRERDYLNAKNFTHHPDKHRLFLM